MNKIKLFESLYFPVPGDIIERFLTNIINTDKLTSSLLSDSRSHGSNPIKSTMKSSSFFILSIPVISRVKINIGIMSYMLKSSNIHIFLH